MPRLDEISSTEKLLELIRKGKEQAPEPPSVSLPNRSNLKKQNLNFTNPKINQHQKSITVGVDIGHEYLRLVKTVQSSEKKWKLLEYKSVHLPTPSGKNTPEFAEFLKLELTKFCGSAKKIRIWVIISASRVEVRHLLIPKVGKKQIPNVVYWTAKKEAPFEEKESIFDFEVQGEAIKQGIPKLSVMTYTAPKQEVEEIKKLFSKMGLPLTGISTSPFAIQNLFRTEWIPTSGGTVASLFIGNDFSRIDIYSQGNLVLTRGIKAGINSMLESLVEGFNDSKQQSFQVTGNEATTTETEESLKAGAEPMNLEEGRKLLSLLSTDSTALTENEFSSEMKEQEIFEMILPALERLIRQVERTFEHYTVNLGKEKIGKVYISSTMDIFKPLMKYVGEQLGIDRDILDPIGQQISLPGADIPLPTLSERIAFGAALGLALADNTHTPNLIFTYKEKEQQAKVTLINRVIFVVFMIAVSICTSVFLYQGHIIKLNKGKLEKLQQNFSQYQPLVDKKIIMDMVEVLKQQQELTRASSERNLGMAVIGELSSLTPANIRFTNLKVDLGLSPAVINKRAAKDPKKEAPKESGKRLSIEGIVLGDLNSLETSLIGYVMKLEGSPLFSHVKIQKTSFDSLKNGQILRFTIDGKIGKN